MTNNEIHPLQIIRALFEYFNYSDIEYSNPNLQRLPAPVKMLVGVCVTAKTTADVWTVSDDNLTGFYDLRYSCLMVQYRIGIEGVLRKQPIKCFFSFPLKYRYPFLQTGTGGVSSCDHGVLKNS